MSQRQRKIFCQIIFFSKIRILYFVGNNNVVRKRPALPWYAFNTGLDSEELHESKCPTVTHLRRKRVAELEVLLYCSIQEQSPLSSHATHLNSVTFCPTWTAAHHTQLLFILVPLQSSPYKPDSNFLITPTHKNSWCLSSPLSLTELTGKSLGSENNTHIPSSPVINS